MASLDPDRAHRALHYKRLITNCKQMFTRARYVLNRTLQCVVPCICSEHPTDDTDKPQVLSHEQDNHDPVQTPAALLPVPPLAMADIYTAGRSHLTILLDLHELGQPDKRPEPKPNAARLSWSRIFGRIGLEPEVNVSALVSGEPLSLMEVDAEVSDPHYLLYLDCLRYLGEEYPQTSSFSGCLPDAINVNWLKGRPECFGMLVNVLVDILPWSLVRVAYTDNRPLVVHAIAPRRGALAWIVYAVLAMQVEGTHRGPHWHACCSCQAFPHTVIGFLNEADLYQALFLDCLVSRWVIEFATRESSVIKSPMPWSQESQRESLTILPTTLSHFTLADHDLPDEDGELVRNAQRRFGCPLDIPWLDGNHDGYAMSAILSSYTYIRRPLGHTYSLRHDTALWLSAMTFGLFEAISGMRLPESTLLVTSASGSERILSGKRLLRFMVFWESVLGRDEALHLEHGRQVAALLRRALGSLQEEVLLDHLGTATLVGFPAGKKPEVLFAVIIAIIALSILVTSDPRWGALPEMEPLHAFLRLQAYMPVTVLAAVKHGQAQMLTAGWCAHTVYNLYGSIASLYPYVVSTLMQLPPFIKEAPDEHANCRDDSCVLYTIPDDDAYTPRHTSASCQCDYVRPPLDDVIQLLSSRCVPVVVFEGTRGLRVLSANSNEVKYVAISHVWAEGMGSTTEKGLPTCVVQRISGLVRQILPAASYTPAFWMDSLCVPSARSERKRAIQLMARTWEQNLLRIASSAWVHRVWTLQEGLLARNLYFEFAEGPVDVEECLGTKDRSISSPSEGPLQELSRYIAVVPILAFRTRPSSPFSEIPFGEVVGLLQGRNTTKAEDELIAISTLLPLSVADRRMQSLLLQLRDIPRGVPFGSAPRLYVQGFRWAPRKLVEDSPGGWSMQSGTGVCTEDGFIVNYTVLPLQLHTRNVAGRPDLRPIQSDDGRWSATIHNTLTGQIYSLTADNPLLCDALLFVDMEEVARLSTPKAPVSCLGISYCSFPDGVPMEPEGGWLQERPCKVRFVQLCALTRLSAVEEDFFLSRRDRIEGVLGEPIRLCWLKLT